MGGFDSVDPRYRDLYERAARVLGADVRVSAVEVSGSIAHETADGWSDLDLAVAARAGDYDQFVADWESWLAEITPTVFARRPIAPFIINSVTCDGLTLDVAVYRDTIPAAPISAAGYRVGMLATSAFTDLGEALNYAVDEQLRGLSGPFIKLLQREEHLFHLTGVPHILGQLTTVFLAETGSAPPLRPSNDAFTPEQLDAVAQLPPVAATRQALTDFGLGVARMIVTRGRALFPRYGLRWPEEFAAVANARMREQLGIDCSGWLY